MPVYLFACLLVLVVVCGGFSGGSGCLCCHFVVARGITASGIIYCLLAVVAA